MTVKREKLLRVQGSRSHNGCNTCRLRHIKCDEGAPHCQKCIKAKRPCHYGGNRVRDVPIKFIVYAAPKQPTPFPGLTQAERRSLHHFQHCTAEELPSPFRSELWSKVILRAAEHHPAVRHAIFALSAMHEYYASSEATQVQYDFSMHHYNKSIRQALRKTDANATFDSLLLTSVMFCALEGLKGEYEQSLQHALSGIRILANGRDPSCESPSIPDDTLPQIFLALQTQAMELEDYSIFKAYPDLAHRFPPLPERFKDVDQAMQYLEIIINQLISFDEQFQLAYQDLVYVPPVVPDHLIPDFTELRDCFTRWREAASHIHTLASGADGNEHKAYFLIKIYQSVLSILFECLDKNIPSFDSFEPEVSGMLKLIEVFLESQSGWTAGAAKHTPKRAGTTRIYTVSLGVVPILFEIAHRTGVRHLREEALRLLRHCNRREGVWDSNAAAGVAECLNCLQEEVETTFQDDEQCHRVIITDMGLLTGKETPFKYMIAPTSTMMNSFWLNSFNPPPDMPEFECRV